MNTMNKLNSVIFDRVQFHDDEWKNRVPSNTHSLLLFCFWNIYCQNNGINFKNQCDSMEKLNFEGTCPDSYCAMRMSAMDFENPKANPNSI